MNDKEQKAQRAQLLKRLREERKNSVQRTMALMRDQNAIRKAIRQAMKKGPRTVPEVATATDLRARTVLWHIAAMKKHGHVSEGAMSDGYFRYELTSGRTK
jgi:predicted transcriptional regulator